MTLTTFSFFVFITVTFVVYYLIPSKVRWCWLLIASIIFFYLASGVKMVPYLLYGIVVTFVGARLIESAKGEVKRRVIMVLTLVLALSELFYLKYLFNVGTIITRVFSLTADLSMWELMAPIGISYYTLSITGYVLDVYYGSYTSEKNIFKHALFTCYFPQLVSGPVTKFSEVRDTLFAENRFNSTDVAHAMQRMLLGYFKKCLIADNLAIIVQTVYSDTATYSGMYILFATVCYAFQLYMDFSGCMDIILGASMLFGVKLPENFNAPFYSESLSEFWRRWHITLGIWFKEYVFYPILKSRPIQRLGKYSKKKFGKKHGKLIPTFVGLIVIWFLIGLWHGGTIVYFFASGIIPGVYLISSEILQPQFKLMTERLRINTECFSYRLFCRIRTVALMCVCWIFVCAGSSFTSGIDTIKQIFAVFNPWILLDGSIFELGLSGIKLIVVLLAIMLILYLDSMENRGICVCKKLDEQNLLFRWGIFWGMILLIILFGSFGESKFIYFQF